MDLFRTFDYIDHEFPVEKFHVYGFSRNAPKVIHSYLSKMWQRIKINGLLKIWKAIQKRFLQGSILGPLLLTFSRMVYSLWWIDPKYALRRWCNNFRMWFEIECVIDSVKRFFQNCFTNWLLFLWEMFVEMPLFQMNL